MNYETAMKYPNIFLENYANLSKALLMSIMKHNENTLTQSDSDTVLTARQLQIIQRGKKLAKLIFFDGLSQTDAILKVFPHLKRESAGQNATRILAFHKVNERLFEMLPASIDEDATERLWHLLAQSALRNNNEKMLLELLDRHAKLSGKFKNDLNVNVSRDEEYLKRVELAKKLLAKQSIDINQIDRKNG